MPLANESCVELLGEADCVCFDIRNTHPQEVVERGP